MRTNFFFNADKKYESIASEKKLRRVIWAVTSRCNLSCGMCYVDSKLCYGYKPGKSSNMAELSTEQCFECIDKFKEAGLKGLVIGGGEPFVRQDMFEIAQYAKDQGFILSTATNGTLINEKNADRFIDLFDRVELPLDGFEKTHDSIRGRTYQKILNTINLLKNDVYVSICTIALDKNMAEIPKLLDFVHDLGINEYRVMRLTTLGRGKTSAKDYVAYNKRYTDLAYDLTNKFAKTYLKGNGGYVIIEDAPLMYNRELLQKDFVKFQPCTPAFNIITVLSDGSLTVCPILETTGMKAGNILKDDLHNVFENSEAFTRARRIKNCGGCEFFEKSCFGGCRCAAIGGGRQIDERDPSCPGPKSQTKAE